MGVVGNIEKREEGTKSTLARVSLHLHTTFSCARAVQCRARDAVMAQLYASNALAYARVQGHGTVAPYK